MADHRPWCDSLFRHADEKPQPCNCGAFDAPAEAAPMVTARWGANLEPFEIETDAQPPAERSAVSLITAASVDRLAKRAITGAVALKPGVIARLRRWLST